MNIKSVKHAIKKIWIKAGVNEDDRLLLRSSHCVRCDKPINLAGLVWDNLIQTHLNPRKMQRPDV